MNDLLKSVNDIIQEILLSGVSLAEKTLLERIDVIINKSNLLKCYRIATSLRYLKKEIDYFLKDDDKFSIDRLVFFATQSWLLYKGLKKAIEDNNKEQYDILCGDKGDIIDVKWDRLRLIGIESHLIKGSIMGFSFYFSSSKNGIVVWDYIKKNHGYYNLENFFIRDLPDISFNLTEIFGGEIKLTDFKLNTLTNKIYVDKTTNITHYKSNKNSIAYKPTLEELYQSISSYNIKPIDTSFDFRDYIVLNKCTIKEFKKIDDEYIGKVENSKGYPIFICIKDTLVNNKLMDFFNKNKKFDEIFGYYYLSKEKLLFTPLSVNKTVFPSIDITRYKKC